MWNWIKWFFGADEKKPTNSEKEAAVAVKVEQEIKTIVQEVAAAKVETPAPAPTEAPAKKVKKVKDSTEVKAKSTKKNAKK